MFAIWIRMEWSFEKWNPYCIEYWKCCAMKMFIVLDALCTAFTVFHNNNKKTYFFKLHVCFCCCSSLNLFLLLDKNCLLNYKYYAQCTVTNHGHGRKKLCFNEKKMHKNFIKWPRQTHTHIETWSINYGIHSMIWPLHLPSQFSTVTPDCYLLFYAL